jgi:hypothetical protein
MLSGWRFDRSERCSMAEAGSRANISMKDETTGCCFLLESEIPSSSLIPDSFL